MKNRKDSKNRVLRNGEGIKLKKDKEIYYYRWTDELGKRRTIYSNDLKELREREKAILKDVSDGIKHSGTLSVNDMYSMWVQIKRGLKDNTFQNYQYMYKTFVEPSFGFKKLNLVTKTDVRKFYIYLVEDRHLKVRTVDCVHTVLYQVFELAMEEGYIRNNLASNAMLELKKTKNTNEEKRMALSRDEQKLFEESLNKNENLYIRPVYLTMLDTGLRVGEATGLRWCDINFEDKEISVNHTLVYYDKAKTDERCTYSINTPKTKNSIRVVPMTTRLFNSLQKLKEFQEENHLICKTTIDGFCDFAFYNRFGTVYNQAVLNKTLRRIQRDVNLMQIEKSKKESLDDVLLLPRFSCHILRHTAATRLCEAGVNTKFLMEMLGHSDIRTTMNIYVDVTKDFKVSELSKFESYMGNE